MTRLLENGGRTIAEAESSAVVWGMPGELVRNGGAEIVVHVVGGSHAPSGGFAVLDPGERERRGVTVRGIEHLQLAPDAMRRMLARALSEAVAGRMRPVIGQTFPLERAADAHTAIEARAVVGRTLLLT